AEDVIRDDLVTGVQTCALPISGDGAGRPGATRGSPRRSQQSDRIRAQGPRGAPREGRRAVRALPIRPGEDRAVPAGDGDAGRLRSEERRVGREWRRRGGGEAYR